MAHGQALKDAVDTLEHAPEHWHTTLLIELASENLFNCFELVEGHKTQSISRVSWAARSLLELHYFCRFVMVSVDNARRFREDLVCDYQDLLNTFAKNPQNAAFIAQGQSVLDQVWAQGIGKVTRQDKYLCARDIAEALGEGAPFGDAHKFLSKFVHPTSFSIQFRKAQQLQALVLSSVVESATRIIAHTFPLMAAHIRAHSVRG